jgi:carbonic anhydrase/acetyltransferase-like protein (isoleucine patch superfamily)
VLRGDMSRIRIGARTNIQDGTVIHVNRGDLPTIVGDDVLVGHLAILHACTVEDGAFVGMRATVMDRAVVERGAMVAAGALVNPGKRIPSGELWGGSPAKFMRKLGEKDLVELINGPAGYVELAQGYRQK